MKFSKTILAFVMVAVLSLSMAFVAFAAEGTLEDPHALELTDSAMEITVPANGTVCYYADVYTTATPMYELSGKEITIADANVTVTVYGINWDETLSEASLETVNPRMYSGVVLEFVNASDAEVTTDVVVDYPLGSQNNPIELVADDWGYYNVTAVPAYSSTGFYSIDASEVVGKYIANLGWNTYDVFCGQGWSSSTYFGDTGCVLGCYYTVFEDVNGESEDKVIIQFSSMNLTEAEEFSFALNDNPGIYPDVDNGEYVNAIEYDENGAAEVSVPAGGNAYYYTDSVWGIIGKIPTIEAEGVSCTTYTVDFSGITTECALTEIPAYMMMGLKGVVFVFDNATEADAETTVTFEDPVGSVNNPASLVLNENGEATVTAPAEGATYYQVAPQVTIGKMLDVSAILGKISHVSVMIDGVENVYMSYDIPEDGIIEDAFDEVNMLTGSVVIVVGGTMEPVEGTIALPAKAGTMENPNALVLNEEGKATVSVPAGETVYYWVVPAVAADKYLVLGDLGLTVSVYVDGAITPYEVDENGNVMNAFEDVDKFFTNMVLVELTNTSEEDIEGTVALGIIEEEEDAPQTGVAAAILTVVAVLSGGYVISRRRSH